MKELISNIIWFTISTEINLPIELAKKHIKSLYHRLIDNDEVLNLSPQIQKSLEFYIECKKTFKEL